MDALAGRSQTTRGIWLAAAGPPPATSSSAAYPPNPPDPPLTLVLDLEGADGRERGEDDASFERQTALYAMAVADILVVNMWAKDVGREAGAGKPLLRTIFQVDLKLRASAAKGVPVRAAAATAAATGDVAGLTDPSSYSPAKKVLLFAFRDRTRTPLPTLAAAWAADLEALWGGLAKPAGLAASSLSDFFDVHYTSLPNYEDAEAAFRGEVAALRARFDGRAPDALRPPGTSSSDRLPGSALPLSLATMWEVVRSQRDLNLPAHKVRRQREGGEREKERCEARHVLSIHPSILLFFSLSSFPQVMVANLRCAELGESALAAMTASPAFLDLTAAAATGPPLPAFGADAAGVVAATLAAYDADAAFFEPGAAADRRADLAGAAMGALAPAHARQLGAAACAALDGARAALMAGGGGDDRPFTTRAAAAATAALASFDAVADAAAWPAGDPALAVAAADAWPVAPARAGLEADVTALASHLTAAALADAEAAACASVRDALTAPTAALLDAAPPDLWPRLARTYTAAVGAAAGQAVDAVAGYGHAPDALAALRSRVAAFGRGLVEARAREAARGAPPRLKERWADAFSRDEAGLPRSWAPGADVAGAAAGAKGAAAGLLGALTALRLPEVGEDGAPPPPITTPDAVDAAVAAYVAEGVPLAGGADGGDGGSAALPTFDLASATAWPPALIPPSSVLLSPDQVRSAWAAVQTAADRAVRQALATVEARAAARGRAPPLWAILAIAVLGADELLAALRSPLRLAAILLALLFARTVYVELGVDEELARGLLPGCIALAAKLGPTVRGVAWRTAEAVAGWVAAAREDGGGGGGMRAAVPGRGGFHPLGDAVANGTAGANGGGDRAAGLRQRRGGGGGDGGAEVEMVGVE